MQKDSQSTVRPLLLFLAWMALAYLFLHSLAGGTLLAANSWDSYALQAQNWLAGRCDIAGGESYTWLELAVYEGRYYVSFPPVPSVLLLPWVALARSAAIPSNLIIAGYGLLCAAGVYLLFARHGAAAESCVFWAALVCMGSNFWWMSTNGGVWFQAQVLNLTFVVWGLCFAAGEGTGAHTAAAFLLALAVGCRPFSILILGLYLLRLLLDACGAPGRFGRAFWLPLCAALAVGVCFAGYNYARFGSIFEFGHTYLPEFQQAENGQFSAAYLVSNLCNLLRPITLGTGLDLDFPLFNGFLLFAANPVFLLWAVRLLQRAYRKELSRRDAVLGLCWAAALCALCLHKTMGGWQFGARYTVDLIPYVLMDELLPEAGGARRKPQSAAWFLCAAAVLFNLYGAVYMLTH